MIGQPSCEPNKLEFSNWMGPGPVGAFFMGPQQLCDTVVTYLALSIGVTFTASEGEIDGTTCRYPGELAAEWFDYCG